MDATTVGSAFPLLTCGWKIPKGLNDEDTLLLIKPNAAGKIDKEVKKVLIDAGLSVIGTKSIKLDAQMTELFYEEHKGRTFFPELMEYVADKTMTAVFICGKDAVSKVRKIMGPTDPMIARQQNPASLRALYGIDKTRNSFHASDSLQSAIREISIVCSN
jgi:nucleoside diphosphate kinase